MPPIKLWFNWRFEGLEHIPSEGPVLVAANHISYFDQFSYGYFLEKAGRRPRFLAKSELFEVMLVGRILRGAGQIPVVRGTGSSAPLAAAADALGKGGTVVVFPEGTVTKREDGMPQQGKTGVARLSLMSGVPVTPLASWGAQHIWQKDGKGSLSFARPIWLEAGDAVDLSAYAGDADDAAVLRKATDEVMYAVTLLAEDLRKRYPKRWK